MRVAYLLKAVRCMNVAREHEAKGNAVEGRYFSNLAGFYLRLSNAYPV